MPIELPPPSLRGRIDYIHPPNVIRVDLDVGFGVTIRRDLRLEGVQKNFVPLSKVNEAKHCLVVMLGGSRVIVQVQDTDSELPIARVFLAEKFNGAPPGVTEVFGNPLLDVSTYFMSLAPDFDVKVVKALFNREGKQ